mmetsp:Transcript_24794/g.63212  ORF Transcript_24794/g.63212 Transcript_24794/m.63212 type:complete len:482 (-) Transcript_24794:22-1467(-)
MGERSEDEVAPMETEEGALMEVDDGGEPDFSLQQWMAITCFNFVYSLLNCSMGLAVLPEEATRMRPDNSSLWLGRFIAVCGLSQLISPIAGKLSDTHRSRLGRRRPIIFFGVLLATLGIVTLWFSSLRLDINLYFIGLLVTELGMNAAFAGHCALPADLTAKADAEAGGEASGKISGILALHTFLGNLAAMLLLVLLRDYDIQMQYPLYICCFWVAFACIYFSSPERDSLHLEEYSLTLRDALSTFMVEMSGEGKDFFLVCFGRCFYYMGSSCSVFLLFFLRDMIEVESAADRKQSLSIAVVTAQLVGAAVSVPFSNLSDRHGRKPVIYLACLIMAFSFVMLCVIPTFPLDIRLPSFLVAVALYGVGNAAYYAVDYALAYDCLPPNKSAAEAFGIWGVCGFVGSTAGPLVEGYFISLNLPGTPDPVPRDDGTVPYSLFGYCMAELGVGAVSNVVVAVTTLMIVRELSGSTATEEVVAKAGA